MLQHAHPMKFVAELLGIAWAIYFLWNHNWVAAIITSLSFFLGSTLALWNKPIDHLTDTTLGRAMLVYAKPLNFLVYNISVVPVVYGLWTHDGIYILAGYTSCYCHFCGG